MSRGVNKVILIGNLGNDPEVRYSQKGDAITTISVATSESWKDKNGEQQERTEWHRVKFFGRLAEIAGEYLKKGRQVYIEGKISYGSYEDKDGVTRYTSDIIANEMQMLGNGGGDRDRDDDHGPRGNGGSRGGNSRSSGNRNSGGGRQQEGRGGYSRNSGGNERGGSRGYSGGRSESRNNRDDAPRRDDPPARDNDPFPDDDIPF